MILISELREAVSEICSKIPEIKSNKTVSTDDRFVEKLEKHKKEDNEILVTVIPAFGGFMNKATEVGGFKTYLQFFLLRKIDYKTTEPEDVQTELQSIVQNFLKEFSEHTTNGCYTFGNLEEESIKIIGVTNKAGCCGWEIQITDKTYSGIDGRTE